VIVLPVITKMANYVIYDIMHDVIDDIKYTNNYLLHIHKLRWRN